MLQQRKHISNNIQTYTERLIQLGSVHISCRHAGTTGTAAAMAAMHTSKVFEWIAAKKHDCYLLLINADAETGRLTDGEWVERGRVDE